MEFLGLEQTRDVLGACGSFLILLPPASDQARRFTLFVRRKSGGAAGDAFADTDRTAAASLEKHFSSWKPWESFAMAAGALLLMVSFWFPSGPL